MKRLSSLVAAVSLATPFASACTDSDPWAGEAVKSDDGKDDSSALAVFVDAKLTGKLLVDVSFSDKQTIQDQLLFTVGQLNGMTAVGRVDKAVVTDIQRSTVDGKTQLTYTA